MLALRFEFFLTDLCLEFFKSYGLRLGSFGIGLGFLSLELGYFDGGVGLRLSLDLYSLSLSPKSLALIVAACCGCDDSCDRNRRNSDHCNFCAIHELD